MIHWAKPLFRTLRWAPLVSMLAIALPGHAGCLDPTVSDHAHPPGDPAWVGHTEKDLMAGLGSPSFRLGRPMMVTLGPDYEIDVYAAPAPARDGCADAYRLNACGVVTAVFCR